MRIQATFIVEQLFKFICAVQVELFSDSWKRHSMKCRIRFFRGQIAFGFPGQEEVSLPLFPYRFDCGILPQLRIHDGSGVSQLTQVLTQVTCQPLKCSRSRRFASRDLLNPF